MKIRKLFGNKRNFFPQKFNIYLGISLGNKWFTKENLEQYLKWALANTKDKVLVLIADKIQAINYEIRDKRSYEASLKKSQRRGKEIKEEINSIINKFSSEEQEKIVILDWETYEKKDSFYKEYTPLIYKEFETNLHFKEEVLELTKKSIKDREFGENKYLKLANYFLEEFTSLYSGIFYEGIYYGFYIYPKKFLSLDFIYEIQSKRIFPELSKKLTKEKVLMAVVN